MNNHLMVDDRYKSFGYTHKIEWSEHHKWLDMDVQKKFYTHESALSMHLAAFRKQGIVPTITAL